MAEVVVETMERGSSCQDRWAAVDVLYVRQTRREAYTYTEYDYYNKEQTKLAHSMDDSGGCCRFFCG